MPLTPAELLMPRFAVNDLYPFCPYRVGDIVDRRKGKDAFHLVTINGKHCYFTLNDMRQMNTLFTELKWYERRAVEDMPEYVKNVDGVFFVTKWDKDTYGQMSFRCTIYDFFMLACNANPATQTEYDEWINDKKTC